MSGYSLNADSTLALRIVLPVIYIVLAIFGTIGNLIVLQIICANRFRHKSIHLLVSSLIFADMFFIFIFTIVRVISYANSDANWILNRNEWCKAEMYLLRCFEFVLAYTIVFMCLDRAVKMGSCWFGIRKFRSGVSIVISIWVGSAYVLIPILFFKQDLTHQKYGGYLCFSTDESVPLFWLGDFPRRVLDFIDIVFRTLFPVFLMLLFLFIASINLCTQKQAKYSQHQFDNIHQYISTNERKKNEENMAMARLDPISASSSYQVRDISFHSKRLFAMVFAYAFLFIICQLPFEIYRCVMLWNQNLEKEISFVDKNIDFVIEIPLLLLKLINRCINPFIFICLADINSFSTGCCRLWCCPCFPGCIGCKKCWFYDCKQSVCYELDHCLGKKPQTEEEWVPTGLQTVSTYQYRDGDRLVTKQKVVEEYETNVEPYYKNPSLRLANQSLNQSQLTLQQPRPHSRMDGIINETFQSDSVRLNPLNMDEQQQRRAKF
jgi:hypothetical protein